MITNVATDQENLPSNVTCLCNTLYLIPLRIIVKTLVIYTDFEKAFDRVDHKLLLIGHLDFINPLLLG